MHAINALLCGIKGAELGTVEIFKRGTASRANWFQDFEGTLQISTGADIQLDSFGGAEVYVNELCDVIVRDATGVQVRNFVAGDASGAVEYQGQSFTGTDYRSGVQMAGKPTNLQEVLDLWKTQNKAIDWQVEVGSVTRTVAAWLGNLAGLFFNAKDPQYGAVGDNVADDTAAINAAFTAASNAGGIVFFPAGTYRVTSVLTLGLSASIMGCGSQCTFLAIDHATNSLLTVPGGGVLDSQWIDGIALAAAQNNTGTLLTVGSSARLLVKNCMIGLSTTSQGTKLVSIASNAFVTRVVFEDCVFTPGGSGTQAIAMVDQALGITCMRCRFVSPATYTPANGMVYGTFITLAQCAFVINATTTDFSCFKGNTTSVAGRIVDCDFSAGGGGNIFAMEFGTYSATAYFIESGNSFGAGLGAYEYVSNSGNAAANIQLVSREARAYEVTSNVTPLPIHLDNYGIVIVHRTTNANQTLTSTALAPTGATFHLTIHNGSGGNITTETLPTTMAPGLTPTINDTHNYSVHGVCIPSESVFRLSSAAYDV